MPRSNFADSRSPLGTPPLYTPEAWAVRYLATALDEADRRREEWRKYGTRHHAEAGIKGMKHFPPMNRQTAPLTRGTIWKPTPLLVELWEYISLSTGGSWYLHETRVYRDGEVFVV